MAAEAYSIGGALRFAGRTLAAHWRAIWGVLALNALASTVYAAGELSRAPGIVLVGVLAFVVTSVMVMGAVFRLTLFEGAPEGQRPRPGSMGLQWSGLESRVLGANLLAGLFLGFLAFLAVIALMAVALGVLQADGLDPAKLTPQGLTEALSARFGWWPRVVTGLVVLAFAYLNARLVLAAPASAARGKLAVLRTFTATRGAGLRVLGAMFLLQLPVFLAATLASAAIGGAPGQMSPPQVFAIALIVGGLAGAVAAPLQAALAAYAYRCFGDRIPDGR